jgi:hypothetical protein
MSMLSTAAEAIIQQKYEQLLPYLNEASLRAWAAAEALSVSVLSYSPRENLLSGTLASGAFYNCSLPVANNS